MAGKLGGTGSGIEVPVIKLSSLVESNQIPMADLIKMDIEGAELKVLTDLKSTLIQYKPIMLISTHGREIHLACTQLLKEIHYDLVHINGPSLENCDEFLCKPQH